MSIDSIKKSYGACFKLIKNRKIFWKIYFEFLKIDILAILITGLLFGLVIGSINLEVERNLILALLPAIIIGLALTSVIKTVTFNIMDNSLKKKSTELTNQSKKNAKKWIPLAIFWILISIIIVVGIFSTIYTSYGIIVWIALLILLVMLIFLIQFAAFELYIGRKGLLESFKRSYSIVKKNILSTILFDASLIITIGILSFLFSLPIYLVLFFVNLDQIIQNESILLYTIVGLSIIATILLQVIVKIVWTSLRYEFWKKIK